MTDSPLITRVQDALRTHVAPALDLDGTGIEVVAIENSIASVRLGDICASCPATLMTVITGMEAELRKHVPEIEILEAVA